MVKYTEKNISGWQCSSIGDIFAFYANNTLARDCMDSENGDIQNVHYGDILIKYGAILDCEKDNIPFIRKDISNSITTPLLQDGDVVMADTAEDNTVGKVVEIINIAHRKLVSGLHTIFMRPQKNLFALGFLGYFMNSSEFHNQLIPFITGIKVSSISRKSIKNICVKYPEVTEQKAIAEALSDIDHLIATTEKLIAKKKDIKKGLMQELMTGKRRVITGATEKVKASELGEIPADWDVLKISDVFRFITNNTHSRSAMNANGGKYRNIHYGDILTKYNEIVDCTSDEIPFLNVDIAVRENALLHTGDVVIADTAEDEAVGKVVEILNADKFAICSGLHTVALRPKERIFAHGFLGYFMNSEIFHSSLLPYVTGIKVSSISKTTIKNAFVLCPPMEEQAVIVSSLRDIDKDINSQILKLYKLQKLKSGMMSELLTGRIRLTEDKGHDEQFDDAVLISAIVNAFYTPQYPLGRKKVQKLLYLARRFQNAAPSGFLKKAAGPYKPSARYSGGEKIAQKSGYVTLTGADKGTLFAIGKNIEKAIEYAKKWDYLPAIDWLVQNFKYTKVDELEVLATVDMAICDLTAAGQEISVENIKSLIKNNAEWSPKLEKTYFSDTNIAAAINKSQAFFPEK